MLLEVTHLARFYETPAGKLVRQTLLRPLTKLWSEIGGLRMLGYGYAIPYLDAFAADAERIVAFMPAPMGVVPWPGARPASVLGDEAALPFPDAFFDRILVVHGLEGAETPRMMLRQLWRVLAPEGRILVIAPNRLSLWALLERSPFACGRPYRKTELANLMRQNLFEPLSVCGTLYTPPLGRWLLGTAPIWDRTGPYLLAGFCGVHIIEAKKTLYGVTPLRATKERESCLAQA